MDYLEQLKRQLGFLERSCSSYDIGFEDESIRVAVVMRTLFHSTRHSTSLLKHLELEKIPLLSTGRVISENAMVTTSKLSLMRIEMSAMGASVKVVPKLNARPSLDRFIPADEWWTETIAITDLGRVSRRDVVRGAADKDGGAHVDERLNPEYETLIKGWWYKSDSVNTELVAIGDAHLSDLRQMGYEVLNSPQLLTIVGS